MIKPSEQLIHDFRVATRVKENRRVRWQAINGDAKGQAKIRNISESGMLLETGSDFKPYDHCVFSFDADLGMENYIPQTGRLVWYRRNTVSRDGHNCGVQFIEPSDFVRTRLIHRVNRGLQWLKMRRAAANFGGVLLVLGVIVLTGFALWLQQDVVQNIQQSSTQMFVVADRQAELYRHFGMLYKKSQADLVMANDELGEMRRQYMINQDMLKNVAAELSSTRTILAQTQEALARSQGDVSSLAANAETEITAKQMEFENAVALLTEKNRQLTDELKSLDEQLMFYAGNVMNEADAKKWLDLYRDRLGKVKEKIAHFRRQARGVRQDAQREMDRVKMVLGNNGYFMRNGQKVVVDAEKYQNVTVENAGEILNSLAIPADNTQDGSPRKVDIDVDFFK